MTAMASRLLPSIDDPNRNHIRATWDRLRGIPGGKVAFSHLVGRLAPYTGTISPRVVELRTGYAEVEMDDRRAVRNHLRCVHAVALANLAELTGNIAVAYTLPNDARFIVAGMSLDYVKKARGRITGSCDCPIIETSEKREYEVNVVLRDPAGEDVVRAVLRTLVGPKRAS
jgi:acyl-coenzyme A thioesterase PaaI-like protein